MTPMIEETLIVRDAAELETALVAIITGISGALDTAKGTGDGPQVFPPQDLKIRVRMVTTLAAATATETETTPAHTITKTETTPANTVTTTDTAGATTETTIQTPPNRTTTRAESGGDEQNTDTTYENVT